MVFAFLDEVIEALHPKAIHIGHDEAFGWTVGQVSKWLRLGEVMIPRRIIRAGCTAAACLSDGQRSRDVDVGRHAPEPTEFPGIPPGIFTAWPTGTASRFVSNCRAIL